MRFDFPVISVGNLSVGGTGKTPHVEYLIHLLQYVHKVATLSRGYRRSTHGFVIANPQSTASQIGDEPKQFKVKFPETIVTVCEDRVLAIPRILGAHPETDVILMDDAYQHRGIRAGLSILLTEYSNLFTRDYIMPIGWLREEKSNYKRADIIIISKCPLTLSKPEKDVIITEIRPYPYQKIYFSAIQYGPLYSFYDVRLKLELNKDTDVILVCGIAKHEDLKNYLQSKAGNVYVRSFADHHNYDRYDLESIRETITSVGAGKKIIVTTEKDAARLGEHGDWFLQNKIEIFVQPVTVGFLFNEAEKFNADILHYVEITKQKNTLSN